MESATLARMESALGWMIYGSFKPYFFQWGRMGFLATLSWRFCNEILRVSG